MPVMRSFGRGSIRGLRGRNKAPALYPFTSFTFTNAGGTGYTGPSLAQMQSAYAGQSWLSTYFSMASYNGYQRLIVPQTGDYLVTAKGAAGGSESGDGTGGYGAQVVTTVSLIAGETITMVVGQQGYYTPYGGQAACGGGGTFLFRSGTSFTTSTVLVAAGGGAGITNSFGRTSSSYGSLTSAGNSDYGNWTAGGVNGNGGVAGASAGGGAGAGITGAGAIPGSGTGASAISLGAQGGTVQYGGYGGFGGGGGFWGGGGGGGGYSGGAGAQWADARNGGGGGSYSAGSSTSITALATGGHGSITIASI